jgi:hypothetical protein
MQSIVENAKNRGSITVEASIIVPVIILCIAAVAYMGLLLQQKAAIQSAAESAAEAGALAWSSGTDLPFEGKPGVEDIKKPKLYRRLFDSEKESRLGDVEEYAQKLAARNELLKPVNTSVSAELKDYVIYKKLVVSVSKSYKNPLGRLSGFLGKSETIDITAVAVSSVDEPAELIRTTDFIIDVEKKLENKFPGLKNLAEKTRNAMKEMKDKLSEFLE